MRRAKPGDKVLVGRMFFTAVVERVEDDRATGLVKILLDWGENGKSRVWEHDYGSRWVFVEDYN